MAYIKAGEDFDIKEAQKYILGQIPQTRGITNIIKLRKKIALMKQKEKECEDTVKNTPEWQEHEKLSNGYYKLEGEYKEKANKEEVKAFQKFFVGVKTEQDTEEFYSYEIWMRDKVIRELERKYPDATEEDLKKIARRFAIEFRDTRTDFKKFEALSEENSKLWIKESDKAEAIKNAINAKFFGERWYNKEDSGYFENILEEIAADKEKLRKAYNRYKSYEQKEREKKKKEPIEQAKQTLVDKEIYEKFLERKK